MYEQSNKETHDFPLIIGRRIHFALNQETKLNMYDISVFPTLFTSI